MDHATQSPSESYDLLVSRIGCVTRMLRDSLLTLGLDRSIMEAAQAMPDAHERLNYIIVKTTQAAERALSCVEEARPLQDKLSEQAQALSTRWDAWLATQALQSAGDELVNDTRAFLTQVPQMTRQTNEQLTEIMMAQDFQDLTGQVIHRMIALVEKVEDELIKVLLESFPSHHQAQTKQGEALMNGPQINKNEAGVVASQDQVDDLLDSLGF